MAEFCNQCAKELGFAGDLNALCKPHQRVWVLCEGCGTHCIVDYRGDCVSDTCDKKHGVADKNNPGELLHQG